MLAVMRKRRKAAEEDDADDMKSRSGKQVLLVTVIGREKVA